MEAQDRILHRDWDRYDTRQVVYKTAGLTAEELKRGYDWAYGAFYSWRNILRASFGHESLHHSLKHFTYAGGWKKFEPLWNFLIKTRGLSKMLPLLEAILSTVNRARPTGRPGLAGTAGSEPLSPFPAIA